jgi:hypothetical protein
LHMNTKTRKREKVGASKKGPYLRNITSSLHVNDVMPLEIVRDLNYIDSQYVRSNGGANFLAYRFRINDLFDPDPLILSGSISGFKEIMQFYNFYRVEDISVDLQISNNEAFSLLWGIFFSTIDYVGGFANRDDAINSLENGISSGAKLLCAKGGIDKDSYKCSIPVHSVLGNQKQYESDINYTGTVSTDPASLLYVTLIIASPSATFLTNGVTTYLKMKFRSRFFSKIVLRA